ncbi:MAG: endonuclease/exonuclease/phosphatase family protein [Gammaproteobacteria bacterium]
MLSLLTFNTALQNVRILNHSAYCPIKYVNERLFALTTALLELNADIIVLQELFHRDLQGIFYKMLKRRYPYVSGFAGTGLKFRVDNELLTLSRYPLGRGRLVRFRSAVLEEKIFTNKGFFHTPVSLPGMGNIDLINFHTTAGGLIAHPESARVNTIRAQQIDQILDYVNMSRPVILAGDLNAGPQTSTINYRQVISAGFIDTFSVSAKPAISWDPGNPLVAAGKERHLPAQRIDHIFVNGPLTRLLSPVEARIVLNKTRLTTASGAIPLSDHYGVLAVMQPVAE